MGNRKRLTTCHLKTFVCWRAHCGCKRTFQNYQRPNCRTHWLWNMPKARTEQFLLSCQCQRSNLHVFPPLSRALGRKIFDRDPLCLDLGYGNVHGFWMKSHQLMALLQYFFVETEDSFKLLVKNLVSILVIHQRRRGWASQIWSQ